MLELIGVTHVYRFALRDEPQVTGVRGLRMTVIPEAAIVKVGPGGAAISVQVSGREPTTGMHSIAIFHGGDVGADPVAERLAQAAEREFTNLRTASPTDPKTVLAAWPDPDARPTY